MQQSIKSLLSSPESEENSSTYQNILCLQKILRILEVVSKKSCEINLVIIQMEPSSEEIKLAALQLTQTIRKSSDAILSEINRLHESTR